MQFWKDDRDQAMKLARLIADIEPGFRSDVTFLFSARFDTKHDQPTVDYVAKKFPVAMVTTKKMVTGWPAGCNNLWVETYQNCIVLVERGVIQAKSILFVEADAIPLHKDWINMLLKEYNDSGKDIMGAWLKRGDAGSEHINGNCMMSVDFWKKQKGILNPVFKGGWDAICAPIMLPYAHPSRLIYSDYHLGAKDNPWKGDDYLWEPKTYKSKDNAYYGQRLQPVWLHGPKDMRGIEAVRKKLCK